MGNKQSSSSNNSTTTNVLNQNTVNSFNKSIFSTAVETMTKNLNSCSSANTQNNTCSVSNMNVAGNFTFGGTQSNKLASNFSCTNASKTQMSMATDMMNKAAAEMKSAAETSLKAQQVSGAAASTTTGAGATAIGNSSATNSSNTNNTNITNQTVTNLTNLYEQNLKNSFTSDTVNECIGKNTQTNNQTVNGVNVGGSANISCVQTNSLEAIQECKALADVINETTSKVLQESGFKVAASNTAEQAVVSKSESTNTAVATGPIQDLFSGISGVMGASTGGPMSIVSISCIVIVLCVVVGGMAAGGGKMSGGGNKRKSKSDGIDIVSSSAINIISNLLSSDSEYL